MERLLYQLCPFIVHYARKYWGLGLKHDPPGSLSMRAMLLICDEVYAFVILLISMILHNS